MSKTETSKMMYPRAAPTLPGKEPDGSSVDKEQRNSGSSKANAVADKVEKLLYLWGMSEKDDKDKWRALYMPSENDQNAQHYAKRYLESIQSSSKSEWKHDESPKTLAKLFVAFDYNSFELGNKRDTDRGQHVVYWNASRFNHSVCMSRQIPPLTKSLYQCKCRPNVTWMTGYRSELQSEWKGWATRDIKKGDQLFIDYINAAGSETTEERRERLRQGWGFDCHCPKCDKK
ncbi:hypothetical protein F5Y16DRAFT_217094 [Xylariaceae sp. FL0255]|nr:hypothetical protein F5Y16DRAFT_217094 [Xylariaceae sp. FL0255]